MTQFAATEAKDKWGLITETALREPVTITRHGRASLVVTSKEDYDSLQRLKLEHLRSEIQVGIDQLERGEAIELNGEEELQTFFDEIKSSGRKRLNLDGA